MYGWLLSRSIILQDKRFPPIIESWIPSLFVNVIVPFPFLQMASGSLYSWLLVSYTSCVPESTFAGRFIFVVARMSLFFAAISSLLIATNLTVPPLLRITAFSYVVPEILSLIPATVTTESFAGISHVRASSQVRMLLLNSVRGLLSSQVSMLTDSEGRFFRITRASIFMVPSEKD